MPMAAMLAPWRDIGGFGSRRPITSICELLVMTEDRMEVTELAWKIRIHMFETRPRAAVSVTRIMSQIL